MKRAERKQRTHQRIVNVAARRFREEGLAGAGVQRIMEEAGLTHGTFYSHFDSKADLVAEALVSTLTKQRKRAAQAIGDRPGPEQLARFVADYLSRAHRDAPGTGCPMPSLGAEVMRASAALRRAFDAELRESFAQVESAARREVDAMDPEEIHTRSIGIVALCVGGMLLARAVEDSKLSDDILRSCRRFAGGRAREEKEARS
jgi:TetR/AcrR family transcriptional repressor of nem operon